MYTNVDSLTNKLNELEIHAELYNADVILITEHLSKNPSSKYENVFTLKNYNCLEDITGRGVCVFYKDNLVVNKNDMVSDLYNPSLFISIKTKDKPVNIGLIYRSPNNDVKENKKLNYQLNFAAKKLKNLYMFGDFNHPSIDWEYNYSKRHEDHCDSLFLYEVTKLNLSQLITSTTHHKPKCKSSLIDLVLTKHPDSVYDIKHYPPIAKSHHQVITLKLKSNSMINNDIKTKNEKIKKPNFDKANFSLINNFFNDVDWNNTLLEKDVNQSWDFIKNKIDHAIETFVPSKFIKTNKIKSKHITLDDTLHFLLKQKRIFFKIYKKHKTKTNLYNYNIARNRVSSKIRLNNKLKENKIAKNIKQNPKAFYQYIASKTLKKDGVSDLINVEGNLTSNDSDKCNILNNFFSSVFTQEDDNIPDFKHDKTIDIPLNNCSITDKDMEKALSNLNHSKSPGPDNFHPKFLKNASKSLSVPLKILFDKTMSEGTIPDDWKTAEVRPIFKKGDKSQANNYRPVSLTSIICKIMESFIKNVLNTHLINNNLLSKEQFGFVSGRSTVTQLLVTINDWMYELDNDVSIDAAYMDFKKAFDTVPHQRLINKLKGYNINGNILNWISSFLTNRYQYVKINNSTSDKRKVSSGVPQGSVLGPTLFIYYINDLPNVVENINIKIFADDTKAYKGIKNEDDAKLLQKAIDEMFQWTQKWLLQFNKDKCKILHLGKNNPKYNYTIGEEENIVNLSETELEKDLGIYIDPNLDLKKHIKSIVKKASHTSYKILKNFSYKTSSILVPLFKTLVRPILEYGNNVWTNKLKKYTTKIENVQRKFTKHIKGLSKLTYEERLKKINLPSLEFRQKRGDMIQVFKIAKHFYDPLSTDSIFKFSSSSRLRGHNYKISKQYVNKSKYANFFSNRVINEWNNLPEYIVNAKTINEFKNLYDKHTIDIHFNIDITV